MTNGMILTGITQLNPDLLRLFRSHRDPSAWCIEGELANNYFDWLIISARDRKVVNHGSIFFSLPVTYFLAQTMATVKVCPLDGNFLKHLSSFSKDKQVHRDEKFTCNTMSSALNLKVHENTHQGILSKIKCELCEKEFHKNSNAQMHMRAHII